MHKKVHILLPLACDLNLVTTSEASRVVNSISFTGIILFPYFNSTKGVKKNMSRENYPQSRKKQQLRRLRELNEKSEIALWFLESYGLKLSFLTVQEAAINEMHSLEFDQPSANDGDQENLEIFARQILCQ